MTRRLFLATVLLAAGPALAAGEKFIPPGRPVPGAQAGAPGPGGFGRGAPPAPGLFTGPIAAPHPSGAAVVELLEDDAGRLARALQSGRQPEELARAGAWGGDCFSGVCCLKVAGYQRFRETMPGWVYPVVGNPRPGEYRYLRFAWKRPEGQGVMIQLCAGGTDWGRYFAGANTVGFQPALQLALQPPREWEVVTRDLFEDFGRVPFTLSGMAFTSMDGIALFDHVYLGRSVEAMDKITNTAAQWARRTQSLDRAQLDHFWNDLASDDAAVRQPAVSVLGACGASAVPYLAERLTIPDPAEAMKRIGQAIGNLDAPRFVVREKATQELERFGPTALPQLEATLKRPDLSAEWRSRLEKLAAGVKAANQVLTAEQRRTLRAIHILEQTETPAAKELLTKLSKANLEAGLSGEAATALERVERRK